MRTSLLPKPKRKKVPTCSRCGEPGHNRAKCKFVSRLPARIRAALDRTKVARAERDAFIGDIDMSEYADLAVVTGMPTKRQQSAAKLATIAEIKKTQGGSLKRTSEAILDRLRPATRTTRAA